MGVRRSWELTGSGRHFKNVVCSCGTNGFSPRPALSDKEPHSLQDGSLDFPRESVTYDSDKRTSHLHDIRFKENLQKWLQPALPSPRQRSLWAPLMILEVQPTSGEYVCIGFISEFLSSKEVQGHKDYHEVSLDSIYASSSVSGMQLLDSCAVQNVQNHIAITS